MTTTDNQPAGKPVQLTEADVHRLYAAHKYEAIDRIRAAGQLDDMLGIVRHYPPPSGQWTRDDLDSMHRAERYSEIAAASAAGQLAHLLADGPHRPPIDGAPAS